MSWTKVRLGSLVAIKTGKLDANASSKDGLYPFFTCAKEPLKISSYSYDCECVLVAGNGDLNVKYYQGKFDAYQRTYIVECLDIEMINTRYLFHFLDTYLEKLREQSIGGVIKYIKLENLTDAQIPLPPLATQKRIAEILDAADALRRKDQELLKKYDELAQAIFIDMFGDPVKNEMGWDVKKIGSITKVGSGSTPSRQINSYFMGSIPWVKTTEVNGGIITSTEEMISDDALKNSSCKLYPQNSVIIAMYGQGKTRGQVALLGIQATTNQACGVILPCSELNPKFLFNYLKLSYSELRNLGRGGNQENLNKGMIEDYIVMIPPIELQLEFNCIIDSLLNQKTNLKVVKSESLFNSLIQKAFKGELVL